MGDAFLTSYYAHYFIDNGMDAGQQSILLGVIPFALFLGCFILSPFAKTPKKSLWLFRLCGVFEVIFSLCFAFCHEFWSLLLLTIGISFFNGAPFTFLESYAATSLETHNVPYARIRLFGTLGYIVSLLAGYFVLSNLPIRDCYFFASVLSATGVGISFFLKGNQAKEEKQEQGETNNRPFFTKGLILILASTTLVLGAYNASTYLLPVALKNNGMPDGDYSLIRAIAVACELVSFLLMPILTRWFKYKKVAFYISSVSALTATLLACFVSYSPYLFAYLSMIVASLGKSFLFAYQAYLFEDIVGKNRLGTALTLSTGLVNVLATGFNMMSSSVYLNIGFFGYFMILSGVELIGLVVLFFVPKGQPLKQEESK